MKAQSKKRQDGRGAHGYSGVPFNIRKLPTGWFHDVGSYGGPFRTRRLVLSDAAERIDLANG